MPRTTSAPGDSLPGIPTEDEQSIKRGHSASSLQEIENTHALPEKKEEDPEIRSTEKRANASSGNSVHGQRRHNRAISAGALHNPEALNNYRLRLLGAVDRASQGDTDRSYTELSRGSLTERTSFGQSKKQTRMSSASSLESLPRLSEKEITQELVRRLSENSLHKEDPGSIQKASVTHDEQQNYKAAVQASNLHNDASSPTRQRRELFRSQSEFTPSEALLAVRQRLHNEGTLSKFQRNNQSSISQITAAIERTQRDAINGHAIIAWRNFTKKYRYST
jgi:hypothetical protein